jgi:hypothetical protein
MNVLIAAKAQSLIRKTTITVLSVATTAITKISLKEKTQPENRHDETDY